MMQEIFSISTPDTFFLEFKEILHIWCEVHYI